MRFLTQCCLCAAAVLATTACTATGLNKINTDPSVASAASSSNQLSEDSRWQLQNAVDSQGNRIAGYFVKDEAPVELHFIGNRFAVQNACNVMNGVWQMDGQKITLTSLMSTKRMCHPALNDLEQLVNDQLRKPAEVSFSEESLMTLKFSDGNALTFKRF